MPCQFQDITTSKGLESIIEKGRDIINTERRIHIANLENAQCTGKNILFMVDGTKMQESQLGTKNQDSIVGTEIKSTPTQTKNEEDPTCTKISTIRSKIKNDEDSISTKMSIIGSRTKTELPTKNLYSTRIPTLAKITKLVNIGQILDLEYLTTGSLVVELIMDGKSLDENKIHLLTSIGTFCFFVETTSNEKECKKGISQLMPCFNNTFLESKEEECRKGIIESMPCFNNNAFLESNEKVQCVTQIGIQELIPCFANNVIVFGDNSVGPPNINVGPSFPFHLLHFFFFIPFE